MARSLVAASSEYLEAAVAPVTALPITLACWFWANDVTTNYALLSLGNSSASSRVQLHADGTSAGDSVLARSTNASGGNGVAASTAGYTAGAWHHACGVFTSNTSRAAFLDGGNKGANTDNIALVSPNSTLLGARINAGSPGLYLNGNLAEAAIWNVALTDAEVAILGRGYSPLCVRPSALVAYWPLLGRYSPELDLRGNAPLTVLGAAVADHPRVFYPATRRLVAYPEAAGGGAFDPSADGSWAQQSPVRVARRGRMLPSGVTHIRGPRAEQEAQAYLQRRARRYAFLKAA